MSGFVINEDCNHYYGTRGEAGIEDSALRGLVQSYCRGQCTEVVYNVSAMRSAVDGLPAEPFWHGVEDRGEDGMFFRGTELAPAVCKWVRAAKKMSEAGKDPFAFWLQETRKMGRRASITIRMNDTHCVDDENCFMHSEIWRKHPEFRREKAMHHCWDSFSLDYSHPEVREYMLAMVKAVLDRYDMDNLELDWMRDGHCVKTAFESETRGLLTQFLRDVRAYARQTEKRLGHPVAVSVRCPALLQEAYDMGFDIVRWAREGLIDRVVPSPLYTTTDFEIPVAFWRDILPENVGLDIGVETRIQPFWESDAILQTPETLCALAANYFYQGADRLYLFNFMDGDTCMLRGYDGIFTKIGSLESAACCERRHILTFVDRFSCGSPVQTMLPYQSKSGGYPHYMRVDIGPAPEPGRLCELVIGLEGDPVELNPYLNDIPLTETFAGKNSAEPNGPGDDINRAGMRDYPLSTKTILKFDASQAVKSGRNVFWFKNESGRDAKITWAEIHIGKK